MKTTAAVLTLVSMLAASACAIPSEGSTPDTRTVTSSGTYFPDDTVEPEPQLTDDEVYLDYLNSEGLTHSDSLLLDAAWVTCEFHKDGGDVDELWFEIGASPYAPDIIPGIDNVDELPVVMGAATAVYCPEFA